MFVRNSICFWIVGRVVSFSFRHRVSVASAKISFVCFGVSNAGVNNMLLTVHSLVHWQIRLRSVSLFFENPWEGRDTSKRTSVTQCERDVQVVMPLAASKAHVTLGRLLALRSFPQIFKEKRDCSQSIDKLIQGRENTTHWIVEACRWFSFTRSVSTEYLSVCLSWFQCTVWTIHT